MNVGIDRLIKKLGRLETIRQWGRVSQVVGPVVEADAPSAELGAFARIGENVCEVIGFRQNKALLMPLDTITSIRMGDRVEFIAGQLSLSVGPELLGRVLDPLGRPLDGKGAIETTHKRPMKGRAPNPMSRQLITSPLPTGIRVIDGMLTLGKGQRIAIMAGSGVGKSTLMGMFAQSSAADVNVIAMVGERGREVGEFLQHNLGRGLSKSVVFVSTSDDSPALQIKGVEAAFTAAEYFRDQGKNVLMMVDSLTRLAMAQRQIGLSAGEPPTTKGYPPSVFTLLPKLLERGGAGDGAGTITSVNTVLVEGDDMNDPIGDTVRSIVDGHIVLSRRLVGYGHYPPVDVIESLSRTMPSTTTPGHMAAMAAIRQVLATYQENEEMIRLGAYKKGSDPSIDRAIELKPRIDTFLRQNKDEFTPFDETIQVMSVLGEQSRT